MPLFQNTGKQLAFAAISRYWYYTENPNLLYSNNGSILPPVGIIVFLAQLVFYLRQLFLQFPDFLFISGGCLDLLFQLLFLFLQLFDFPVNLICICDTFLLRLSLAVPAYLLPFSVCAFP